MLPDDLYTHENFDCVYDGSYEGSPYYPILLDNIMRAENNKIEAQEKFGIVFVEYVGLKDFSISVYFCTEEYMTSFILNYF